MTFRIGAALLAAGGLLALLLFEHLSARPRNPAAEPVTRPADPALQQD